MPIVIDFTSGRMERRSSDGLFLDFLSSPPYIAEARVRSDSVSSTGSCGRFVLRQRVVQLMTCMEDVSSDDDIHEELSRSLDQAFLICGKKMPSKMQDFRSPNNQYLFCVCI